MIEGVVNAAYEAVVSLSLQDTEGRNRDTEAVANPTVYAAGQQPVQTPRVRLPADPRPEFQLAPSVQDVGNHQTGNEQ